MFYPFLPPPLTRLAKDYSIPAHLSLSQSRTSVVTYQMDSMLYVHTYSTVYRIKSVVAQDHLAFHRSVLLGCRALEVQGCDLSSTFIPQSLSWSNSIDCVLPKKLITSRR